MRIARVIRIAGATITFALCAIEFTGAQNQDEPGLGRTSRTNIYQSQIEAADHLVTQPGKTAADLVRLFQISRLLSEPCDQIHWLRGQIDLGSFDTGPETRAAAKDLLTQLAKLEQANSATVRGCNQPLAALRDLLTRLAEPPTPWNLRDPAQLAARWTELGGTQNAELLRELTPDRIQILLSRGLPVSEFDLNDQPAWDAPRQVMDALAVSDTLPATPILLQLDRVLREAENESASWTSLSFPVLGKFQISRGLLDRALGIDGNDHNPPLETPNWAELATALEARDYWSWAALARILEAADASDPTSASQQAATQWGRLSQVTQSLGAPQWPAVSGTPGSWLTRLQGGNNLNTTNRIPLTPDYRRVTRSARRSQEDLFLQSLDNPTQAIRLIQLAKAADIGLNLDTFQPLTLAEIKDELLNKKVDEVVGVKVIAAFEMIRISRPDRPSQYYAVLLNAAGWNWTDKNFNEQVIGPKNSPVELVRDHLDQSVQQLPDLQILIAPDGGLDRDWFEYEQENLLPYAGPNDRTGKGWIAYAPSLTIVRPSAWSLDTTLRHFQRGAGWLATNLDFYTGRRAALANPPREIRDLLDKAPSSPLYSFSIGAYPSQLARLRPQGFITAFKAEKRDASPALPGLLVLTGR